MRRFPAWSPILAELRVSCVGIRGCWRFGLSALIVSLATLVEPRTSAAVSVQEGVGFIAVSDAREGETVILTDGVGSTISTGTVDALGSYVFRELRQGQS